MTRFTGKVIAGVIGFFGLWPSRALIWSGAGSRVRPGLWRALQLSGPEAVQIMRDQFLKLPSPCWVL